MLSKLIAFFFIFIENAGRPAAEIQKLQSDVTAMKRTLSRISDVQEEILTYVKKLKKCVEADQLEIGKCCHTVGHILAHFLQF
jgi:hypothetical protein